ncbi:MAG: CoA-binding protein [Bacteroidales bacterium]|jgi:predicted CoA-binding protein|nr:CoA-binding protein [Bacteroidales bacterium]
MTKKESIQQFLAPKRIAIAGVSRNNKKFGYVIFNELRQKGFEICPINPTTETIDGITCYKSVSEIPANYEKLFIVTPKNETDEIIRQAAKKGIKHIWVQQMSNTSETSKIANEFGIDLINNECIFMFAEPVTSVHKFHRFIWKVFDKLPK